MDKLVKILEISNVAHNVRRFVVEKPLGYFFTPGQATEMSINKPGFVNKKHPFTFTSLNSDRYLEFTIKQYPVKDYPNHKGVTEELHQLSPGDELIISEPFGAIEYKGEGVFIAGGAGLTPFIAIFRDLKSKNRTFNNKIIYSNKTRKDVIYHNELRQIFTDDNLILVFTQEKVKGAEFGRIDKELLKRNVSNFSQNFYLCGPWKMIESLQQILKELGSKPESLVFEK